MKSILVLYFSRGGHTAKISRCIAERLQQLGHECDSMDLAAAEAENIDWQKYDAVVLGACVLYGTYDKSVFAFCSKHQQVLAEKGLSFFSVNVVARKPEKRIPENNKYLQKFIALSDWKPKDVKIIAGKVDNPSWGWLDSFMIRLIMKMTGGPTDPKTVIDYTDWEDVKHYAEYLSDLAS